jgi:hypothetical protein
MIYLTPTGRRRSTDVKFYLGTHQEGWLDALDVPLFVSHRRLRRRKTLPRARVGWALDSGGFSELSMHGRWVTSEAEYLDAVRRYDEEVGQLEWAAPMDWMCEPWIVTQTGLSVGAHQIKTVENFCRLRQAAPDLPFVPVLQGWDLDDYLQCIELYLWMGIDVTSEPRLGLGSVCRRQSTAQIGQIVRALAGCDLKLHGFGVKTLGLTSYGRYLDSADSMAWSYAARRSEPLPGCSHKNCANCLRWAWRWRRRLLFRLGQGLRDHVPARREQVPQCPGRSATAS